MKIGGSGIEVPSSGAPEVGAPAGTGTTKGVEAPTTPTSSSVEGFVGDPGGGTGAPTSKGGGGGFDLGSMFSSFNPLQMIGGLLGGLFGGGQSQGAGNGFDLGGILSGVMDLAKGILGGGGGGGGGAGNPIGGLLSMFGGGDTTTPTQTSTTKKTQTPSVTEEETPEPDADVTSAQKLGEDEDPEVPTAGSSEEPITSDPSEWAPFPGTDTTQTA